MNAGRRKEVDPVVEHGVPGAFFAPRRTSSWGASFMSKLPTFKVMISSRNADLIDYKGKKAPLSRVRTDIKKAIVDARIFGQQPFDVWINEDAVISADGSATTKCLDQAREADLLVVLYNGEAGWSTNDGVGICHAEMEVAINQSASKVFIVELPLSPLGKAPKASDLNFRTYVGRLRRWRQKASNGEEAIDLVEQAVVQGFAEMARRGAQHALKGAFASGDALDWSRMNLGTRASHMTDVVRSYVKAFSGAVLNASSVTTKTTSGALMFVLHAIPDALTLSAARELVGQPFIRDYKYSAEDVAALGPVHLIACNKGVTVSQARKLLGIDDATYVEVEFGVYVADEVMKTQVFLMADCRDATSTRRAAQSFFDWLETSGEADIIYGRAAKRKTIVAAVRSANK